MRVAIDARYIHTTTDEVTPQGGVGRYTFEIIRNILEINPEVNLTLLRPHSNIRPIFDGEAASRVTEIPCVAPPHSLRTLFAIARKIDPETLDLFHSPFNVLPLGVSVPAVTTVHDIMWIDSPELAASYLPKRLLTGTYYRFGIGRALRYSTHILTVSEATKKAIVKHHPGLENRITVTPNAVGSEFTPLPEDEAMLITSALIKPGVEYVLCVGQGSPYKNHGRAINAFLEAFADRENMKLVLLRRFSRLDRGFARLMARDDVSRRVILLPKVNELELRALYCRANILLFPSLIEGFGLPSLEAMASGTPVVASDCGAVAEVSGDAAVPVDPNSTSSIAEGLRRARYDQKLRHTLIEKGFVQAGKFRWRDSARKTLEVYQSVSNRSSF